MNKENEKNKALSAPLFLGLVIADIITGIAVFPLISGASILFMILYIIGEITLFGTGIFNFYCALYCMGIVKPVSNDFDEYGRRIK